MTTNISLVNSSFLQEKNISTLFSEDVHTLHLTYVLYFLFCYGDFTFLLQDRNENKNFPNWCGNISSLVGKFLVSGGGIFGFWCRHFLSQVWKFVVPIVRQERKQKNVHTRHPYHLGTLERFCPCRAGPPVFGELIQYRSLLVSGLRHLFRDLTS